MKTKKIYSWWIVLMVSVFSFISCWAPFVQATWEVDLQFLRDSAQLSLEDTSMINGAMNKVEKLKKDIDKVTNELFALDEIEKQKDPNLTENYRQARVEMVKVLASINSSTENVSNSLKRLIAYQRQIKSLVKELRETQVSSEKAKEYLKEYMVLLYKMQLKIYDQDGDNVDDVRLFVNSDNFNETFIWNDLLEAMTVELSELIDKSSKEEERKTLLLSKLWDLKLSAQKSIEYYRDQVDKLEQKKQYLLNFIRLYKRSATDASKLDMVFKDKEDVNKMVLSFVDDIVQKNFRTDYNIPENIQTMLDSPDSSDDDAAPIAWPIYPIENIVRYFNDSDFEKENWFKFQSIQVEAEQKTPVYAARDGVVYYVSNTIDNISWVVIVHKDWYVTVYEYMNQIIVNPWDIVQRGQLIGYSWGEPWTLWAWFASEWENLTFSVYKNGVAVDPLTILDLSVVTDWQNTLPEEYKIKYLNDQLVRPIDVSDLKFVKWTSVDERAQAFLSWYGVWVYKELNFWDSVVEWTNIDRDVVICIALAESTLGRHLTTSNNIWNVGNNDRWDRVGYGSPYEWARLIPLTLNNQYLWWYHTINQLSRYGNEDGKIYASSPINWQRNVMRCLSRIKWYTVPEDFPFRVWPNPNLSDESEAEETL